MVIYRGDSQSTVGTGRFTRRKLFILLKRLRAILTFTVSSGSLTATSGVANDHGQPSRMILKTGMVIAETLARPPGKYEIKFAIRENLSGLDLRTSVRKKMYMILRNEEGAPWRKESTVRQRASRRPPTT